MERAILRARGNTIRDVDVPGHGERRGRVVTTRYQLPLRDYLKDAEREYIEHLLEQYHGAVAGCARHASVDQATLHRKIKGHGLRAVDFRHNGRPRRGVPARVRRRAVPRGGLRPVGPAWTAATGKRGNPCIVIFTNCGSGRST